MFWNTFSMYPLSVSISMGGGGSRIPGLGVTFFRDSGFIEKNSGNPVFELFPGLGFQGGNFEIRNLLNRIPGLQDSRDRHFR